MMRQKRSAKTIRSAISPSRTSTVAFSSRNTIAPCRIPEQKHGWHGSEERRNVPGRRGLEEDDTRSDRGGTGGRPPAHRRGRSAAR